jgi:hypothetical protein
MTPQTFNANVIDDAAVHALYQQLMDGWNKAAGAFARR